MCLTLIVWLVWYPIFLMLNHECTLLRHFHQLCHSCVSPTSDYFKGEARTTEWATLSFPSGSVLTEGWHRGTTTAGAIVSDSDLCVFVQDRKRTLRWSIKPRPGEGGRILLDLLYKGSVNLSGRSRRAPVRPDLYFKFSVVGRPPTILVPSPTLRVSPGTSPSRPTVPPWDPTLVSLFGPAPPALRHPWVHTLFRPPPPAPTVETFDVRFAKSFLLHQSSESTVLLHSLPPTCRGSPKPLILQ